MRITRRTMLRGLGGVAIALPALEVMFDRHGVAFAQGMPIPKRYLVCFGGQSLGGDGDPLRDDYVPNTVGPNYDLKSALAPLAPVQSEVSVVSGLSIPTANAGPVPAAGRRDDFHVSSLSPLLSGVRSPADTSSGGPTSDQLVADAIAGSTPFKSLVYRVQVEWYLGVSAPYGRDMLSYKVNPAGGNPIPMPPVVSPKAAFDALFSNFAPPSNAAERARQDFLLRSRKSVLDLVAGKLQSLASNPQLGTADQQRLQRHFDEIRALELQVSALPPRTTATCQLPMDPGADPPIGGAQGQAAGTNTYSTNLGYSDEETRAKIFCDLVHMAFTCDLSRVGSLMFTMFQSHMNMFALTGAHCDLHEIGHNGDPVQKGTLGVSKAIAWHMKHFAYLVGKLRDTPEGAGRMIDNAAILFLHEGGHGLDTATGKTNSSHSTENMACLIAGRAGGLKPGQHVAATGKHPANVVISAMTGVGMPPQLGEVFGTIPALFA
ncbi:MAG: DUF1552 domain-containing protein [Myxococcota bacterium]|nr:DUF1552 domain-containing protein [Myxococcota bacterium]